MIRQSIHKTIIKTGVVCLIAGVAFAASAKEHVISQLNKSFDYGGSKIDKLTIKTGDNIRFKNEDPFFHNIFSLSGLETFDLGSFPMGQSKVVEFNKAGLIEIECAIHPQMYLEVTVK